MVKNHQKLIGSGMDSNVYLYFGKKIVKEYYNPEKNEKYKKNIKNILDENILAKYHLLHHNLSKIIFEKDISKKDIYYGSEKVHNIEIYILDLGDTEIKRSYDINTREKVLLTEPKPILSKISENELSQKKHNKNSQSILFNIVGEYFESIGLGKIARIHPKNFSIESFENGELKIVITDLGNSILQFMKYEKYIYEWIENNKTKKAQV